MSTTQTEIETTGATRPRAHAPARRRSISFDEALWREVERYRADEHAATESEAVRRLVVAGLRAVRAASRGK